jgi:Spy/CpxP family protein refolding chaperone
MSLQRKLTGIGLTLGLVLTFGVAAFAQDGASQQQDNGAQQQGPFGGRGGKRRGGGGGRRGPGAMMRLMKQLNLSDAQQQQIHAIHERLQANVKPQREEMRRLRESSQGQPSADTVARIEALHTEMGRAMRATHEEILAVLTQEQRTQLEQLVRERKARHEERRGRRQDMPDDNDNQ